ncbi:MULTISPECIES: DUF1905 domain-containing protein [Vagococcus]|uniref:DUF1905 domain-containing protein n=1 Tax=Vagococcus fluvialis bH819 TaxID=1255619 RepID=A0A1X6WRA5_9ENTE|nr:MULTISPECIES: DUF1905 domain-containing protein [Vagococcus]SLM86830.1 hypothetical protein FM121_12085 [Vagococcus fluvialis bH819]HCM88712.1 DUF1905 domain-containing protein [Vagococcus sp.]
MKNKEYKFESVIKASEVGKGGAFIIFPYDLRSEFGKGRVKVTVLFDHISYTGSIVNMGMKREDGSIVYVIGIRKDIRKQLSKEVGDTVSVIVKEVEISGK